jgi:nitroimidazol reductase NimA-like FMN-containing flavoprotein (pyridoxamine 5'-phosphate oxidase superfamily)
MEVDRNGLEVLGRDECLRLLRSATIGRVGTTIGALPTVLPVNFRVVGDRIVFRTTVGTKLDAATTNSVVAFEADAIDPMSHAGWSVVVTGIAREVTEPDELSALLAANIPFWAPTTDGHVVSIRTEMISGRRLSPQFHSREEGS